MGTFSFCIGERHIPDEKKEKYNQRIITMMTQGGMMQFETAEMFGKRLMLLKRPDTCSDDIVDKSFTAHS